VPGSLEGLYEGVHVWGRLVGRRAIVVHYLDDCQLPIASLRVSPCDTY
jgi:hypothetical protein